MTPHRRLDPVGRVCMVCGRGKSAPVAWGGLLGAGPILRALGYEWDPRETLGFAHVPCLERKRKPTNGS